MGVVVSWYNEDKHVIIYEFSGQWAWDEYKIARQACRAMLDTVDYPVDQIYDMSATNTLPQGIISKFWNVAITSHRNTSGLVVVVGQNRLFGMLTNSIGNVIQKTLRHFDISYVSNKSCLDEHILKRRNIHRPLLRS